MRDKTKRMEKRVEILDNEILRVGRNSFSIFHVKKGADYQRPKVKRTIFQAQNTSFRRMGEILGNEPLLRTHVAEISTIENGLYLLTKFVVFDRREKERKKIIRGCRRK